MTAQSDSHQRRRPGLALAWPITLIIGCTAMSQNLRGQELSYRGAWSCAQDGCDEGAMTQSRRGAKQGDVRVHEVKLNPRAAVSFTAAAPFDRLEAEVRDCSGRAQSVAADRIVKPGDHAVGGSAKGTWIVFVDRDQLGELSIGGKCNTWIVRATAYWDKDQRQFTLESGVRVP